MRALQVAGETVLQAWHVNVVEQGIFAGSKNPEVLVLTSMALIRLNHDAERDMVVGHDRRVGMEGVINIWIDKVRPQCVNVMLYKGTEQTGLQQQVASIVDGSGEEIIESYEVVAPDVIARDVQRSGIWLHGVSMGSGPPARWCLRRVRVGV